MLSPADNKAILYIQILGYVLVSPVDSKVILYYFMVYALLSSVDNKVIVYNFLALYIGISSRHQSDSV